MSCNNCSCNRTIKSNGYTQSGGSFNILTGFTESDVDNGKCYKLILCTSLPSVASIMPCTVQFNGVQIPLLDSIGNRVMSDQLHTRKCYHCVYGTNLGHLILRNPICSSAFIAGDEEDE